ncbi:MAG: TIGR02996 domain-containing protein, partial [Proteobacteria bacterium]|nr:TIGR02996 domain-containing protein [Pseudomonadota bacterium]
MFSHDNLVTPWLVRHAIEHALAGGWTPLERGTAQMFSIKGVLPDRPRNVPTPAPITVTEDELLARIAESAADDDQARLVYADWLLERSDERG